MQLNCLQVTEFWDAQSTQTSWCETAHFFLIMSIHKKNTYTLHSCSEHTRNRTQCSYLPLYHKFLEEQHFRKD